MRSIPFKNAPLPLWQLITRGIVGVAYGVMFIGLLIFAVLPDAPLSVVTALMTAVGLGAFQSLRRESSDWAFALYMAQLAVTVVASVAAQNQEWEWTLVLLAFVATVALFVPPLLGSQQIWIWQAVPSLPSQPRESSRGLSLSLSVRLGKWTEDGES